MRVTCCGHGELSNPSSIHDILNDIFQELIQEGAVEFYLGGYGEFDRIACFCFKCSKNKAFPILTLFW